MKNRKLAALLLGTVLAFSVCIAGCAGAESSGGSMEQEDTTTGEGSLSGDPEERAEQATDNTEGETQKTGAEEDNILEEKKFGNLNEFQALALDGGTITQDDFADKDITVINFWALSCGPCLAEMPELAELGKALPDNVQLMTVCLDGSGNEEYVEYVLEYTGFEGTTLLAGDGDLLTFCQELQYTPTTVLVDSEGNTVGEAIIGAKANLTEFYTSCINSALEEMGKAEISIGAGTEASAEAKTDAK